MKISHSQFLKYTYFSILAIWFILTLHVIYLYVDYSSIKTPIKGGTFVEWTTDKISYLPYLSSKNSDKFYQSMLFNWCMSPYTSGTELLFKDDLCHVRTSDYKTFTVKIADERKWSDGDPITLNDVLFTYNDIIVNNAWILSTLDNYQNIEINASEEKLEVIFPYPSIDNQIFFTNFILPQHALQNVTIDDYISKYWTDPVTSWCAKLESNNNDNSSVVFNLDQCPKTYIKYYQVKQFENENSLKKYLSNSRSKIIDIVATPNSLDWFKTNKVILNKFITLFFNTSQPKVSLEFRKAFWKLINDNIYKGNFQNYFIQDNFIFDAEIKWNEIKKTLEIIKTEFSKPQPKEKDLTTLSGTINQLSWNIIQEFYVPKIIWDRAININILSWFDKLSISDNWNEYTIPTYKKWDKTTIYKISEDYKNIKVWENTYIVKWYNWSTAKEIITIKMYYQNKPIVEIPALTWDDNNKILKYKIIYFNDKQTKYIWEQLYKIFTENWINNYFDLQEFNSIEEFNKAISSKNYDIAIKWIDMWVKKDISNIFSTDETSINPSAYKNTDLWSLIKQYFINEWKVKYQIKTNLDEQYLKAIPFIIIWKTYWNINVREDMSLKYPERLYDYWFRKDYLYDIKLSYSLNIEILKILDFKNIKTFFIEYMK